MAYPPEIARSRFFFSLALLLLSAAFAGAAPAPEDSPAASAVIVEDANLRTSPAETAGIITPLRKDTKVVMKVRHKEWVKVEVPRLAETGWVHSSLIKENPGLQVAQTDEKKSSRQARRKSPRKISQKRSSPTDPCRPLA